MPKLTVNSKNCDNEYGNKHEKIVGQTHGNMIGKPVKPIVREEKGNRQGDYSCNCNKSENLF